MNWTRPAAGKRTLENDDGSVLGHVVREGRGRWRAYCGEDQYGLYHLMADAMIVVQGASKYKQPAMEVASSWEMPHAGQRDYRDGKGRLLGRVVREARSRHRRSVWRAEYYGGTARAMPVNNQSDSKTMNGAKRLVEQTVEEIQRTLNELMSRA